MKTILIPLILGCIALAQTPAVRKPAAARSVAPRTPAPNKALLSPATLKAKAPDNYKVRFTTTKGDFVVEVHRDWAPLGADRFYNLVKNGYYTDASFFRVLPGFVVQFGINANPAINKAWRMANIQDDPGKQSNKRGYLTFATGGPGTRTTQVFINLVDNAGLDSMGFSPFGEVTEGMDVVDKFYSGYGEGAPSGAGPAQDRLQAEGKAYLDKDFPQLDSIKSAKIEGPPAPAATPAKKPLTKKPVK
jgi:peptidyl-prolyl cis-trans isomerase A (cyclophilin A)